VGFTSQWLCSATLRADQPLVSWGLSQGSFLVHSIIKSHTVFYTVLIILFISSNLLQLFLLTALFFPSSACFLFFHLNKLDAGSPGLRGEPGVNPRQTATEAFGSALPKRAPRSLYQAPHVPSDPLQTLRKCLPVELGASRRDFFLPEGANNAFT
jgi:hypothetical protein